jgi:hypothetical protein
MRKNMEIEIETFRNYSQKPKLKKYEAEYLHSLDLTIKISNEFSFTIRENLIDKIIKKKFNLPGLSKSETIEILKENNDENDFLIYNLDDEYFEDDFLNILFFIHIFSIYKTTNNLSQNILEKHFSDNIALFNNAEFNEAIPFTYFLPLNIKNNNIGSLQKKGFLNRFTLFDQTNNQNNFVNYYKPFITPNASIFLNESEKATYYWILEQADIQLRKFAK